MISCIFLVSAILITIFQILCIKVTQEKNYRKALLLVFALKTQEVKKLQSKLKL